jgi:hypothetical protein
MLTDRLNKSWTAQCGFREIDVLMRFEEEGLVLGAGTVLAKFGAKGAGSSIETNEPRLRALLTAAHLLRPSKDSLAHLSKALIRQSEGQEALAATHLVLSRLDRLARPETDAHRLFLADGLLEAGFSANAIIDAVMAGDADFSRLQKYDPDQPRIPAGSGRTSGQWTSGDEGSPGQTSPAATPDRSAQGTGSVNGGVEAQSPVYQSKAEVNPSTVTEVVQGPVGSAHACQEAEHDCIDAAVFASRNDAANDNSRFLDLKNCRDAGWACDTLSWIVEDIPFVDHAGVIFPHRGVVLIDKGQLDRYLPPLRGRAPPIRRS